MGAQAWRVAVYKRLPRPLQRLAVRVATPNFTVGAVGLLTDDGSRLLMVRPTYRKGWLPPGGFLGKRETPVQALHREISEELGLLVDFAEPHRVFFDVKRQAVTFISVGVLPPGTEPRSRSAELSEVRWFALDALPPLPHDFHEGLPEEDLAAVRGVARGVRPSEGG